MDEFEKEMEEVANAADGKPTHNEAPASMNMKCWIDGYGFMFTIREGATNSQVVSLVEKATKLVELAKKGGWKTDWNDTPVKTPQETAPEPQEDVPVCPVHKKAMTKRKGPYGEFYSCGTKLPDGSWCKETVTVM